MGVWASQKGTCVTPVTAEAGNRLVRAKVVVAELEVVVGGDEDDEAMDSRGSRRPHTASGLRKSITKNEIGREHVVAVGGEPLVARVVEILATAEQVPFALVAHPFSSRWILMTAFRQQQQ
ncbi:hypothetical protein AB0C70_23045 [Streptomyces sp. NPDC048564]|uniref:hypothetical protein n=1 Tax=Streptomyces sp. NPDC048564 TaxID=3155760 RepID=UPI0034128541